MVETGWGWSERYTDREGGKLYDFMIKGKWEGKKGGGGNHIFWGGGGRELGQ